MAEVKSAKKSAAVATKPEKFSYKSGDKEVKSAEKATEIAFSFVKKHRPFSSPLKAVREGDIWLVEIDVGLLSVIVARFKIDARSGKILEYSIPEGKGKP